MVPIKQRKRPLTFPGEFLNLTGVTMASFGGHAIPGSFFLLFGFWLTVKRILQHYWRTNQPKGRGIMPPLFKRLNYIEGGFAIFASLVGQFPSWFTCMFKLLKTCCQLIAVGPMLFRPRYFGRTVRSKWPTSSPLWHSKQFVGQADELAAQHHVSVFWDLWDNIDCQYCIQTGASRCRPPCSLLGSFCWRWAVQKQSFDFLLHHRCVPLMGTGAMFLPCFSRVPVLLPRAQSAPSGCSHPHLVAGGRIWWVSQRHAAGVHQRQHYSGASRRMSVNPAGLMVLPGDWQIWHAENTVMCSRWFLGNTVWSLSVNCSHLFQHFALSDHTCLSFQIGFVLYPLSGPEWDLTMHDNVMFVTMCFCWHLAVAMLLVTCISSVVWL